MTEKPFIETISDESLDKMIERRKDRLYEHIINHNDHGVAVLRYHLLRAQTEKARRELYEGDNNG